MAHRADEHSLTVVKKNVEKGCSFSFSEGREKGIFFSQSRSAVCDVLTRFFSIFAKKRKLANGKALFPPPSLPIFRHLLGTRETIARRVCLVQCFFLCVDLSGRNSSKVSKRFDLPGETRERSVVHFRYAPPPPRIVKKEKI